jgi:bisphosphoglycerate-dependent phosphoglycerate mutase
MKKEIKIAKSAFHSQGYWTHGNNKYEIKSLPIKDLWASVPIAKVHLGIEFFEPIKKDIAQNGMKFPILVVTATRRELLIQKHIWKEKIKELPFKQTNNWQDLNKRQYVVWGGSNRIEAVRQLGYTHIDCAMMLGFVHARAHQRVHRQPYLGKYYAEGT